MPRNQKLTKVITGRKVKVATAEPDGVLVMFDDESCMKIKTAGPAPIPPGGKVKSVRLGGTSTRKPPKIRNAPRIHPGSAQLYLWTVN